MKAARPVLLLLLVEALLGTATCFFIRQHIYVNQTLPWTEAQTYCRTHYVDLSTIGTQEEYTLFKFNDSAYYSQYNWIGLNKRSTEPTFTQWSDGTLLGFTIWKHGEPNNPETEHCVSLYHDEWYDKNCSEMYNFFCYTWKPRMIVVQKMKTWMEALEHCRKFYSDLISLTTENDLFIINNKSLSIHTSSVWIGLRFLDGSWFWVNKEPLGNLIQLPSCPARPWVCGAKKVGEDNIFKNRDCEEKMNFICYHW